MASSCSDSSKPRESKTSPLPSRRSKGPDNTIISVFGRKGSGKSVLVNEIAEDYAKVIVLDSMAEYGEEQRYDVLNSLEAAALVLPRAWRGRDRFRFSVRVLRLEDAMGVLSIVYEMPGVCLIVEETSLYCSPSTLPEELQMLVRYGRHREISMVFVSRRPAEIHRDLTAQSDLTVCFRQHEQRDILYLRSLLGDRAEELRNLPLYAIAVYGDMDKAPLAVLERLEEQSQKGLDRFSVENESQ